MCNQPDLSILGASIVSLLCYAAAMIPLSYLCSNFSSDAPSALTTFTALSVTPALVGTIVLAGLEILYFAIGVDTLDGVPHYVRLASIHPTLSITWAMSSILLNGISENLCATFMETELKYHCKRGGMPSCCQRKFVRCCSLFSSEFVSGVDLSSETEDIDSLGDGDGSITIFTSARQRVGRVGRTTFSTQYRVTH